MNRLPGWFNQDIPDERVLEISRLILESGVHTVCRQAKCPNLAHCFRNNDLTFMILGNFCTRNCSFCNVDKTKINITQVDYNEPYRITELVKTLGLRFVVITSVTRDDLDDGGAGIFAKTIQLIKGIDKSIKVEVLIPDFQGKVASLRCVLAMFPDVLGHNIETVERLYKEIRPMADYKRSLELINRAKQLMPQVITKSSIMLGFGETEEEVVCAMQDLRNSSCDCLTLGQYLAPSLNHCLVKEFISPEQFVRYMNIGLAMGFRSVLSGPKVRSSYHAEQIFHEIKN